MNKPDSKPLPQALSVALLLGLGGLHALSFSIGPLPSWILPFYQITLLAIACSQIMASRSVRQAFGRSYLFGLGHFGVGIYWLYISMHQYGGMPSWMAALGVLLLAAALAVFPALASAVWQKLRPKDDSDLWLPRLLLSAGWASCWALSEWLRGNLLTGFPWLNIGYAHAEGMFTGWAPVVGVYGLAWLSAFSAAVIAQFAASKDKNQSPSSAIGIGIAMVFGLIGISLPHIAWVQSHGAPFIARLVQGNIDQSAKFGPNMAEGIERYYELANLPAKTPEDTPRLIVLPETVIPVLQNRLETSFWLRWTELAQRHQANLVLGVPMDRGTANGKLSYTNSALLISPDTQPQDILNSTASYYDKHHLVPFGEFIPTGFQWFVDMMNIPLGDFHRGALPQAPFKMAEGRVAPNICYEDVFGEEIIQAVQGTPDQEGATLLLNISNLGWFGDSWALSQHLQISRMRALETGRPMLRATNTGMTAAIDPRGRIRAVLPPLTPGVLDVEVQGTTGLTPYVKYGNLPFLIWASLILIIFAWRSRRQR
ncbi:apolipoprotein N-acyltransferase [Providencia rettgeri]|nr:apolipoprotein N-acyltransferase [Providencia rettgeri]